MPAPYILLDRDGTLIKHIPHLIDPDQVELLPNVIEGMKLMKGLGFKFGIITNQSVIGRGLATRVEVDRVNARVIFLLEGEGLSVSFVLVCPHTPSDHCKCRKPLPQLGIIAVKEYAIDISSSYMIGDAISDITFGKSIGCGTIQIINDIYTTSIADYATIDLLNAAEYIDSKMKGV